MPESARDPRHHVHIDVVAIAECIVAAGAFDDKAMFLVERDGRAIVGIHLDLDARNIHPLLAGVDCSDQQRGADPGPTGRCLYPHADRCNMPPPEWAKNFQPELTDDLIATNRYQTEQAIVRRIELCRPVRHRLKRKLQRVGKRLALSVEGMDLGQVCWLKMANGDGLHGLFGSG